MLVLSRRVNETIIVHVGDEVIEVMVTAIDRNKVRIGITANPEFQIHRAELLEPKEEQPC